MSSLFGKVAFYPTLYYNLFWNAVGMWRWYDRIDDTVLMGGLPLKDVAEKLIKEENVKGVITMNEEFETRGMIPTEQEWQDMGVRQLCLPTVDYSGTPTQENIQRAVTFINEHKKLDTSVYVHCKAGRTRSATVVACYLLTVKNYTPEEAISYVMAKRPQVWLREKQIDSVKQFHSALRKEMRFHGA